MIIGRVTVGDIATDGAAIAHLVVTDMGGQMREGLIGRDPRLTGTGCCPAASFSRRTSLPAFHTLSIFCSAKLHNWTEPSGVPISTL